MHYSRKKLKMVEIGKKAVLIIATVIVALMFIIPASARVLPTSSQPALSLNVPVATTASSIDPPGRRRRIAWRRWHYHRVHRARAWRRHERFERRHRG
jgi:hypothetical protein